MIMTIALVVITAVVGYLLGSLNTSLLVGRVYGVDVRQHGSGNAGTTNTLRVLGKSAALLVLAGDILKGVISCLAGFYLTGGDSGVIAAGTAAIIGHNWPLYFGFKGGKGVLTSAAVIFMMDWRIGLIVLGIFALVVAITRYVSLGSVVGAALFPVIAVLLGKEPVFSIFAAVIALMIILRHRSNIDRLLKGTESKLGAKKSQQPTTNN
jgi:glycerol-3-phosphate acyltransferase PlsY